MVHYNGLIDVPKKGDHRDDGPAWEGSRVGYNTPFVCANNRLQAGGGVDLDPPPPQNGPGGGSTLKFSSYWSYPPPPPEKTVKLPKTGKIR